MSCIIEVLFAPAEFRALANRDLAQTTCVVFDVLRATSVFVTALANGAEAIIPVAEISEAVELRRNQPELLLAGERGGLRIGAGLSGGIEFDFGNSPREFTSARVAGKTIASTTTNGTRALRACARAERLLIGSFLNLSATAGAVACSRAARLLIVCAGTEEDTALEDVLGAGALTDLLRTNATGVELTDSAEIVVRTFLQARANLSETLSGACNARRLLARPALHDDVAFCLERDRFALVAASDGKGWIRKQSS